MSLPTQEQWRPVVGWEPYYEVSDHGNLRTVTRVIHDTIGRHRHWASRPITPWADEEGRLCVRLSAQGKQERCKISTLVITAFVGPRPRGMECCHNDGDCTNNHIENLRWDTRRENLFDLVRHGNHGQARKTHCPYGHPLDEPNLVPSHLRPKGVRERPGRTCLACSRARAAISHARRMGREPGDRQQLSDFYYAQISRKGLADGAA